MITYTFQSGDPPMTCPNCGSRTDFKEQTNRNTSEVTQHHTCRNCGFEFLAEEDNEVF